MILSCNSCKKKFVVPDNAISVSGRVVQCSSCGNKWKQFPLKSELIVKKEIVQIKSTSKTTKEVKKRNIKKRKGPSLYTSEYLTKKYGIEIGEKNTEITKKKELKSNIHFGFYNYLVVLSVLLIFFFRILYFSQDIIVEQFPITKIYINYFFESFANTKGILLNFFFSY